MGKKKKTRQDVSFHDNIRHLVHARRLRNQDRKLYEKNFRNYKCLFYNIKEVIPTTKVHAGDIRITLAHDCPNIEHQIITLRDLTQMTTKDFYKRRRITQELLNCLLSHHGVIYEGLIFGSSTNGLGFVDSDVDLRLRPLQHRDDNFLEPIEFDRPKAEEVLRNIAYQTTRCSPAAGTFVPSRRCPIAKLMFLSGNPGDILSYEEAIHVDISLLSANALGSFNSVYVRFLCHLEPKFHLLASALRYWSKCHDLIQPGNLSSYALVNMLIFFCHNLTPPLLPTVDEMRDIYLQKRSNTENSNDKEKRALTRQEWLCMICLDKDAYKPSENKSPLSLLLLQFFEFYLNFPYSGQTIMITRNGSAISYEEFKKSSLYDHDFKLKPYLNIQDPFDMKHNLTSGIEGPFFSKLIAKIRHSYEKLFKELLTNFKQPEEISEIPKIASANNNCVKPKETSKDLRDWGLNAIFC